MHESSAKCNQGPRQGSLKSPLRGWIDGHGPSVHGFGAGSVAGNGHFCRFAFTIAGIVAAQPGMGKGFEVDVVNVAVVVGVSVYQAQMLCLAFGAVLRGRNDGQSVTEANPIDLPRCATGCGGRITELDISGSAGGVADARIGVADMLSVDIKLGGLAGSGGGIPGNCQVVKLT